MVRNNAKRNISTSSCSVEYALSAPENGTRKKSRLIAYRRPLKKEAVNARLIMAAEAGRIKVFGICVRAQTYLPARRNFLHFCEASIILHAAVIAASRNPLANIRISFACRSHLCRKVRYPARNAISESAHHRGNIVCI